jgi:hypothetical protein
MRLVTHLSTPPKVRFLKFLAPLHQLGVSFDSISLCFDLIWGAFFWKLDIPEVQMKAARTGLKTGVSRRLLLILGTIHQSTW